MENIDIQKMPTASRDQFLNTVDVVHRRAQHKRNLANAVRVIVDALYVEPVAGFVQNEADVDLGGGVVVSVEGRVRNGRNAIVRINGANVLNGSEYVPGKWEAVVFQAADDICAFGDVPPVLADIASDRIAA